MKKYWIPVIAASLGVFAAQGSVFAEEAVLEDGQNPVMNLVGIYGDGNCVASVETEGDDLARISVYYNTSVTENTVWTMSGFFDQETMSVEYSDGVRLDKAYSEADYNETTVYEGGTGRFVFADDYTMTWEDDVENMEAGEVFQFVPINGNPENIMLTEDLVLAIELPGMNWTDVEDPEHWLTVTNGTDKITVDHLRNGENLPSVLIAGKEYAAVYQSFVSTKNEVFVVLGSAAEQESLEQIMRSIATIRILKFDTKTAVETKEETSTYEVKKIDADYVVTAEGLNVREGFSTEARKVGSLNKGDKVHVVGSVIKDGKDTGWFQIGFGNGTAYASSKFLAPVKSGEKPASEPSKDEKKEEEKKEETPEEKKEETPEEDTPAEEPEIQEMKLYGSDGSRVNVFRSNDGEDWTDESGLVYQKHSGKLDLYYESVNKTFWYTKEKWDQTKLYNEDGKEIDVFRFDDGREWKDTDGRSYVRREGNAPVFEEKDGTVWSDKKAYWDEVRAMQQQEEAAAEEPEEEEVLEAGSGSEDVEEEAADGE